jgi:hypothetical protein
METVSEKLIELDNTEWYRELFNNRHNGQNGNKLRTYRLYKHDVNSAFCKNSAGYQDKSSVSQIWYQCQVYENCQQILKFQKTDCISNRRTNCTP